ncbi:hypothetical protein Tco_1088703, partial [Tanacetum coccineum]
TMGTNDDEAGASRSKRSRLKTVEEVLLPQVHHEFLLWEGCSRDAKSSYNTRSAQLLPRHIYSPCIVNWDVLNRMGYDGEIDDMLRIRFDEVCADDELQTKKIIKFRLGGRAHSLTLLEFARRLRLYQAVELEEDGFNVYFKGGLRNDDNFNAQDYWTTGYDKVQKNDLWILSMFDARHQNGHENLAWVIARWMKRKGVGTQKKSQICCGQFILKLARKCRVLFEDVVRSLTALIYCRDLDTTTIRDLINSNGKLIPEDPQPGDAIERMEYRQSYHWDRYHGVFEHVDGVYSVPMQGAYNLPGYAQPQYDQYYQQYLPPPPQQ